MSDPSQTPSGGSNKPLIALLLLGGAAALTWAISTFFGITLTKALAAVILIAFLTFVALMLAGIA